MTHAVSLTELSALFHTLNTPESPMAKLFEYAIVYSPKKSRDPNGNDTTPDSEILVDVTRVLAHSDKEVGIRAAREIPTSHLDKLTEVEIIIRPFN